MMRASIVGLIFVSMASFGGAIFGCESSTLEAKLSAIEKASIAGQTEKQLAQEVAKAERDLGILRSIFLDSANFMRFANRVRDNKLRAALSLAKYAKVTIIVDDHFSVRAGFIVIDHRASDEEIIRFLLGDEKPEKKKRGKEK